MCQGEQDEAQHCQLSQRSFSHDLFAQPWFSLKTHRWVKLLVQPMVFYNSGIFESCLITPHYHSKAVSAEAAHDLFPLPPKGTTGDGCTMRSQLQNQTLSKASADRQTDRQHPWQKKKRHQSLSYALLYWKYSHTLLRKEEFHPLELESNLSSSERALPCTCFVSKSFS